MKKLILVFFSFFFIDLAFCESFKLAGKDYLFEEHESGLLIQNCKKSCDALKVLKIQKYKPSSLVKGSESVSSYGSDACSLLLGGKSLFGKAMNGDGRDFCLFKDKSLVEMYSLTKYLEKNKIIKE